jgi:hypothetical protein
MYTHDMLTRKRKETKIESLIVQLDFFDALRNRHILWANDTIDPEIIRAHLEIVDLIIQTRTKYKRLLDMYGE